MEENKKTYSEDHVLAMFEEIKGQGRVVIEQYSDLSNKVGLILEDIDEIKSDIVDIKSDIREMKVELGMKAEKSVTDNHENRILKLEKTSLATG